MNRSRGKHLELYLDTYKSTTDDEIIQAYKAWAPHYDEQMRELCWKAPDQIALLLADVFSMDLRKTVHVLDVGAGTGLVGLALASLGFGSIDAFDISSEMLKSAEARQVYKDIYVGNAQVLSQRLTDTYDAVVCVGALNFGHIAPSALNEFLAVTRPYGFICFSTREDYFQQSSKIVQEQLTSTKKWELIVEKVRKSSISDMHHRHWLYRKL